ncbi:acetylornithine deacetylase [Mesorhizobium sp. SB112]|uniref:acetylornithine deacetylase n=1 Tax=Mesorhizobium sp. SB112 TaxID=3151853 RepID=UPI0032654D8F
MNSIQILEKLIGFPTVSRDSNLDLINFVAKLLETHGIPSTIIANDEGTKANLYATVGPDDVSGIMLSGHTDVVPIDGQNWTKPPFEMTESDGLLYGRGTADMKGFVAAAIAACIKASKMKLATPLHLALSYDEELGCLGVHSLIDMLKAAPQKPLLCIIGEPTNMQVATGHKGKVGARAICTGREGHSALAPLALNAIHLGCDFVNFLRDEQARLVEEGARDGDYDISYSTVHVGKMNAGVALNIVPNHCQIDFEIRNVAADDPKEIMDRIKGGAERIVSEASQIAPEAAIDINIFNTYPGLDTPTDSKAVAFVKSLTGANGTIKVAFGTEGGLFSRDLGTPTVVCGPGSMAQGHKPDEFVSIEQMGRCDEMLDKLLERLVEGGL